MNGFVFRRGEKGILLLPEKPGYPSFINKPGYLNPKPNLNLTPNNLRNPSTIHEGFLRMELLMLLRPIDAFLSPKTRLTKIRET